MSQPSAPQVPDEAEQPFSPSLVIQDIVTEFANVRAAYAQAKARGTYAYQQIAQLQIQVAQLTTQVADLEAQLPLEGDVVEPAS